MIPITHTIQAIDQVQTGEAARMERLKHRLSQRQVSKAMGCSAILLCDLERGYRSWDRWVDAFNDAMMSLTGE